MPKIPSEFIRELEERCRLEDIVPAYLTLKRRGKNLVGLCPFHSEKSPSFIVYPGNNSYYCFGCGKGGGVINFVMEAERLDFVEAVRWLAQRAGLQVPENGQDDTMAKLRVRILEINREAGRFFYQTLMSPEGRAGLDYFRARGLDSRTIRHFGLGYAPDSGFGLVNHLRQKGYTKEELTQSDMARVSQKGNLYDRYRSRVMFPIFDLRGNVTAFGGRVLTDEKPKYINTADTPVYHKSSGLFAMNFAKNTDSRQLILAEGYMDVIALHRAGFQNAIASLGTSLTEEQARILKRYADEVVICYDADGAGQKACGCGWSLCLGARTRTSLCAIMGKRGRRASGSWWSRAARTWSTGWTGCGPSMTSAQRTAGSGTSARRRSRCSPSCTAPWSRTSTPGSWPERPGWTGSGFWRQWTGSLSGSGGRRRKSKSGPRWICPRPR